MRNYIALLILYFFIVLGCRASTPSQDSASDNDSIFTKTDSHDNTASYAIALEDTSIITGTSMTIDIHRDINIRSYFPFMDSLVDALNRILNYPITEHIIVHHNPCIIDSLASFDYYIRMNQGMFIYDQRDMVILRKTDKLDIPDSTTAAVIKERLENTLIDVNIPEFKLRIYQFDTLKYTFTVRVGRNEVKYLKTAGRNVSLRTPIGDGKIVRIAHDPYFVNPVDGRPYSRTTRDDGKVTRMPQIPWLEPEIGGLRHGSLIHPTSNPETLGKAYSNGCIGTGEGDAWIIYYHAPLHTKVRFRYDLEILDQEGKPVLLNDIYKLKSSTH